MRPSGQWEPDQELPLPDYSQGTIADGHEPLVIADFFYEPLIPIFVDGSPSRGVVTTTGNPTPSASRDGGRLGSLIYSFFDRQYPRQELNLQPSGPQPQSCAGTYSD